MDVKLLVLLCSNNWLSLNWAWGSQGLGRAAPVLPQFLRIKTSKEKYNNKTTKNKQKTPHLQQPRTYMAKINP